MWCDVIWSVVMRWGLIWPDVVWSDEMIWYVVGFVVMWYDEMLFECIWFGLIWKEMIWIELKFVGWNRIEVIWIWWYWFGYVMFCFLCIVTRSIWGMRQWGWCWCDEYDQGDSEWNNGWIKGDSERVENNESNEWNKERVWVDEEVIWDRVVDDGFAGSRASDSRFW